MVDNNKIINQHLRRQLLRKWIIAALTALLFIGFMSYALYKEHDPSIKDITITDDQ